jgi:hypothetical protein
VKDAELRVTADAEGQVFVRDVVQTGIFHDIWIDERHLFWGGQLAHECRVLQWANGFVNQSYESCCGQATLAKLAAASPPPQVDAVAFHTLLGNLPFLITLFS